jgi:hypothetical protein
LFLDVEGFNDAGIGVLGFDVIGFDFDFDFDFADLENEGIDDAVNSNAVVFDVLDLDVVSLEVEEDLHGRNAIFDLLNFSLVVGRKS